MYVIQAIVTVKCTAIFFAFCYVEGLPYMLTQQVSRSATSALALSQQSTARLANFIKTPRRR